MDDEKTVIYEGRPINVDDLQSQVDALAGSSVPNWRDSDSYRDEARKLDDFRRSLKDDD